MAPFLINPYRYATGGGGEPLPSGAVLLMHFDDDITDSLGRHTPSQGSGTASYESGKFDKQ